MFKSSYQRSLFRNFLLAGALPLLICVVLILSIFHISSEANTSRTGEARIASISRTVSSFTDQSETALNRIASDPLIIQAIENNLPASTEIYHALYSALNEIPSSPDITVYDSGGTLLYTTGDGKPGETLPSDWGLLFSARDKDRTVYRRTSEHDPVQRSCMEIACPVKYSGAVLGYAVIEVSDGCLAELLADLSGETDYMLLDPLWNEVHASPFLKEISAASLLRDSILHPGRTDTALDDYRLFVSRDDNSGFVSVLFMDRPISDHTARILYAVASLSILLCLFLCLLFSVRLSKQVSMPVRSLNEAMEQVEQGNLDVKLDGSGTDELSLLSARFSHMTGQLKSNISNSIKQQQELGETKMRMMQAQLNPHFLYNTLDTMKWLAKIHHVPEISTISANLADILRSSISADEFVPLRDELRMLERYVEIQKIRFPDKFEYRTQIAEDTLDLYIPKLMLQPLVENAIIHGFEDGSSGEITVSSRLDDSRLIIEVRDTGCGIPDEMKQSFISARSSTDEYSRNHLGLHNVDAILRLNYGQACGLQISDADPGTCIRAQLPLESVKKKTGRERQNEKDSSS